MLIEPWALIDLTPDSSPTARTLFNVANGHLGLRGSQEEDADVADQTFVNGFHETWPIAYPEDAYGLARVGQTIQPVPSPTLFRLVVDGEVFDPHTDHVEGFERRLDYRTGQLVRHLVWHTMGGIAVTIESTRLVSLTEPGTALLRYHLRVDHDCRIQLTNFLTLPGASLADQALDPRRSTQVTDPLVVLAAGTAPGPHATVMTRRAGQTMTCVMAHAIECEAAVEPVDISDDDRPGHGVSADLAAGQTLTMTATACFDADTERAWVRLDQVKRRGWDDLAAAQVSHLDRWWRAADVDVDAPDPAIQGKIRWNLFQVLQASAATDQMAVAAKGVSGSGYDGHYFWDCEAMILPSLIHTAPSLARRILSFRHATLPQALERASELALRGASFPWRTIDGREASAFFEAGTAQFHINADIAYAVGRYLDATGDEDYAATEGIDLLVQTARLWASLGFTGDDGRFHIHGVTGPDEYSALVDDNLYTNVMAKTNLELADHWLDQLDRTRPDAYAAAQARLAVTDEERRDWREAAATMTIPFDSVLGIHAQDAHFLEHEVWDFDATGPQNHPLLLHYHPLTIYRHQVLKQADAVLALINRPDLFTADQKRADFDYYDRLTTGDSTLSASGQSIMAAEVGHIGLAQSYFLAALDTDLGDSHANAADGVHVASAGAIWSALTMGFGGLRDWDGLRLDPHLPPDWRRLRFHLIVQGVPMTVDITTEEVRLSLDAPRHGDLVRLTVGGAVVELTHNTPAISVHRSR